MFGRIKKLKKEIVEMNNKIWRLENPPTKIGEKCSIIINGKKRKGTVIDVRFIPNNYNDDVFGYYIAYYSNHYKYTVLVGKEVHYIDSYGSI